MAKMIRPVNGQLAEQLSNAPIHPPVIPVQSQAELMAELDRLRAENQRLQSRPQTGLTLRISEKGALSVYGMGRFPTTLYVEQWERLLGLADDIKAFIKANSSKLSRKGE